MADITLVAETGRSAGSRSSRRLRHAGYIPGVVYGQGVHEPLPVAVPARELRAALSSEAGVNAVLTLQVDGHRYTTMARELQRHPVRGSVMHVDFQVVDPNRPVHADVPVNLVGDAVELHRSDGVLEQHLFALTVLARPADIPTGLEVDISGLTVGSSVRVSEVQLPAGVTTELDPETIVVAGLAPRISVEAPPEGAPSEAPAAGAEVAAPTAEAGEAKGADEEG